MFVLKGFVEGTTMIKYLNHIGNWFLLADKSIYTCKESNDCIPWHGIESKMKFYFFIHFKLNSAVRIISYVSCILLHFKL